MAVLFTLCSLSSIRYTGLVKSPMKVSRSLVVTKILASFSFITFVMASRAVCNCAVGSQLPSPFTPLPFAPFPPFPRAGADAGFSALFVSTAAIHHCSREREDFQRLLVLRRLYITLLLFVEYNLRLCAETADHDIQ